MPAPSAEMTPMAQGPALCERDPRQVVTPLAVDAIEDVLRRHNLLDEWQPVLSGIKNGFRTGAGTLLEHTVLTKNHTSCDLDPSFIDAYIAGEQAAGRYSRAFDPGELEDLIGPFRTSPLGLVPKPNSSDYRMIQDLSYPRNDVRPVLACIDCY